MEQRQYNLLFRWFVGLDRDDEVWTHLTRVGNRARLCNSAAIDVWNTKSRQPERPISGATK